MSSNFVNYLKATKAELRHVNWPTRKQAVSFTLLVIGVAVLVSLLLGFMDFVFNQLLQFVLETVRF